MAPGVSQQSSRGLLEVPDSPGRHRLASLFQATSLRVKVVEDFVTRAHPGVHPLALELAAEVVAVARAEGASVDRREGRPLEWEVRNAVISTLGARHAIPTPLNDLVTTLLRACDRP